MSLSNTAPSNLSEPGNAIGGSPPDRWLTPKEYRLLEILASLIVPSDELGPGAKEADVAARLEAKLATAADRQALYRSGLRSLECITSRLCKQSLGDLPRSVQRAILTALEQAHRKRYAGGTGLHHRMQRKLRSCLHAWRGDTDAITLFPELVADVMELFYCSPVAWKWLGYQGPPISRGWYVSEAHHG